jgi:hypothetical protein
MELGFESKLALMSDVIGCCVSCTAVGVRLREGHREVESEGRSNVCQGGVANGQPLRGC